MRQDFVSEVDDAVSDDIPIDATDMRRLVPPQNSIVPLHSLHLKLSELVRLHHSPRMLNKRIFNREVDPDLLARFVEEVAFEFLQRVIVGVVVVFEVCELGGGDFHLLAADQLDSCVGVLVLARVDVAFFVGGELALYYAWGGAGASIRPEDLMSGALIKMPFIGMRRRDSASTLSFEAFAGTLVPRPQQMQWKKTSDILLTANGDCLENCSRLILGL